VIGFSQKHINRFFLPTRKLFKLINEHSFDLVIDLNINLHLASSYIVRKMRLKYRVGIEKELSDLFYNVVLRPDDISSFKKIFSNLFIKLDMFSFQGENDEI
jgi:ADP-heptose:LPS heptosyltransferase